MSREGALWIGGVSRITQKMIEIDLKLNFISPQQLEPYMDEAFLLSALERMGEEGVNSIKVNHVNTIFEKC